MPVIVQLSRKVYDRLGDDVVTEFVDWFNKMDEASHASLRELNELNFARFDAKLEQRIAEVKTDISATKSELLKWMVVMWVTTLVAPFLAAALR